jgi:peptidoglycan hydrolase-like protein with peptidoglycan-binding domain
LFAAVASDKIAVLKNKQADPSLSADELAAKFWEEIRESGDADLFKKFIERFPSSPLSVLAASRFRELQERKVAALPAEPEPSEPAVSKEETSAPPPSDEISIAELTKSLQRELDRVGCGPGDIDGIWGPQGRQAVERFNKYAQLELDTITPTLAAVDEMRRQKDRVCPKLAFDGTWRVKVTTSTNCRPLPSNRGNFTIQIANGSISGSRNTRGYVTQDGRLQFTRISGVSDRNMEVTGTLSGGSGSGALVPIGTRCVRTVSITRELE